MVYTGDMVVSQCRHGFFPLATLSTVGETGISEMATEAAIAVHRARESEPVCGRFRLWILGGLRSKEG